MGNSHIETAKEDGYEIKLLRCYYYSELMRVFFLNDIVEQQSSEIR